MLLSLTHRSKLMFQENGQNEAKIPTAHQNGRVFVGLLLIDKPTKVDIKKVNWLRGLNLHTKCTGNSFTTVEKKPDQVRPRSSAHTAGRRRKWFGIQQRPSVKHTRSKFWSKWTKSQRSDSGKESSPIVHFKPKVLWHRWNVLDIRIFIVELKK